MKQKTTTTQNTVEQRIFAGLFIGVLLTAGLYIYFISISVVNVVQREEIEQQVGGLYSRVGELEAEYIKLSYNITRDEARALGFVAPSNLSYASRKALALQLP